VAIGGVRPAVGLFACAFSCVTLTVGCALFLPPDVSTTVDAQRPLLPPLRPTPDAIQLQVLFVDRPVDDPVVTQLLWQEVDQVGAVPPAMRSVLKDNGLRVAQSGSNVPPTLQTLLGLASDISQVPPMDAATMSGRQLSLLSGQDSEIAVNDAQESCIVRFQLNGEQETLEFPQARCLLRVRPVRVQDGWVKLEFTPEIHHGDSRLRHTPGDEGWMFRGGQKVDVRHALKFQLTLNTGEMAIVGTAEGDDDTLGRRFFRHERDGQTQQRLLVVRISDAGRSNAAAPSHP